MKHLSVVVDNGIATVRLDQADSKVNILDQEVMDSLSQAVAALEQTPDLQGVLLQSAKEGGFVAGANLHRITDIHDPEEGAALAREGQQLFNRWAALPVPVVAIVHGHCMGGGTELALACHGRVASTSAAIALPEVRLGLLPGWGGTQRLPRLVGLPKALDMIVSGRTVRAREALRIGLVDRVAKDDPSELHRQALTLLDELRDRPQSVRQSRLRCQGSALVRWLLSLSFVQNILLNKVRGQVMTRTGGHYPAPLEALQVVQRGLSLPLPQGLEREAHALGQLVTTDVCKALIHAFFLNERGRKPPKGLPAAEAPATVGVLGAGVMGSGIAQWLAERNFTVVMRDLKEEIVDSGLDTIRGIFQKRLARRGQSDQLDTMMQRIHGTTLVDPLAEAGLVIEAVAERMEIKQAVLRDLEPRLQPTAVFATNTSALSVTELQAVAERPQQVGGLHFFNPVHRMPLVEVIRGENTSDATVALLFAAAQKMGKTPIEVRDRPGFLVNRLLGVYLLEACHLAHGGIRWQTLDRLALDFGWPMGPFRLMDEIGLDIIAEVGETLTSQLSYLEPIDLLQRAVEAGLRGHKGGLGFYRYSGKSTTPNPKIADQLQLPEERDATQADLDRMVLLMVNEAGRCMDEGVVADPRDIDTGTLFGLGFPPFRGGLARWADTLGREGLLQGLNELSTVGPRFTPSPWLQQHGRFYHTG